MKKLLMLAAVVGGLTVFGAAQTAKADHFSALGHGCGMGGYGGGYGGFGGYGSGYGGGYGGYGGYGQGFGNTGYYSPYNYYGGGYGYSNYGYPGIYGNYGSGISIGFGGGRGGFSAWNW